MLARAPRKEGDRTTKGACDVTAGALGRGCVAVRVSGFPTLPPAANACSEGIWTLRGTRTECLSHSSQIGGPYSIRHQTNKQNPVFARILQVGRCHCSWKFLTEKSERTGPAPRTSFTTDPLPFFPLPAWPCRHVSLRAMVWDTPSFHRWRHGGPERDNVTKKPGWGWFYRVSRPTWGPGGWWPCPGVDPLSAVDWLKHGGGDGVQ